MKIDLLPIEQAPAEWKDGRQCLVVDFLGHWRVVRYDREGWVWYNSGDEPFSQYPYSKETMSPVQIGAIPEEPADVDA